MKFIPLLVFISILPFSVLAETPPGHPPVDHKAMTEQLNLDESADSMTLQAKVISTITVESGYIYIQVDPDNGDEDLWIALPELVDIKKGDTVHYKEGPKMKDFESKSLSRTFPSVMFLSNIKVTHNNE